MKEMLLPVCMAAALLGGTHLPADDITVTADNFAFAPARIEVHQGDIVRITFHAVDIPHTFIIDGYRIAKRAAIGQTITFEFRADRTGTFPIYCNLTADERCRKMKGELVVRP